MFGVFPRGWIRTFFEITSLGGKLNYGGGLGGFQRCYPGGSTGGESYPGGWRDGGWWFTQQPTTHRECRTRDALIL